MKANILFVSIAFAACCLATTTPKVAGADQDFVSADEIVEKLNPKARPMLRTRGLRPAPPKTEIREVETSAAKFKKRGFVPRGVVIEYFGETARVQVKVATEERLSFNNILFDLGKADLKPESAKQLEELGRALMKMPKVSFLLEGHTCDIGTEAGNLELSERRAATVRRHIIRYGAKPEQLFSLGFGESDPAVSNSSDENRKKNRRVVIYRRAE